LTFGPKLNKGSTKQLHRVVYRKGMGLEREHLLEILGVLGREVLPWLAVPCAP
jgi:hypothetical protein